MLATNLPAQFKVSVIALNRGGHYAQRLRDAGIPVHVLQKRFRFDPLTWWRLRRLLKQLRPDIVQSYLFAANSYVRLPGIGSKDVRVIVSERCVDSWKSGWQLAIDRQLKNRMHALTANSNSVAKFYLQQTGISEDVISVIPNGVSERQTLDPADIRSELDLPGDSKLVGFVGRLAPQKCLKDLVWGFHLLQSDIDNVFLIIFGDGPSRNELAEFASQLGCRDRIYFTGHRDDALDVIEQLDVFCLPSSFEGMSNSLMEAMSAGVPAVVSNIPANLELVEHENTGLVFHLAQGPEIAKSLKRVLEDGELAGRLSESAQARIRTEYSVRQLVDRHVELYERLIHSDSKNTESH